MKSETDVLEHNVSSLLEGRGEPPRIVDAARVRIREALIAKHAVREILPPVRAKLRAPLVAIGIGLAAAALIAIVAMRVVTSDPPVVADQPSSATGTLADGSTYVARPGSTLTVIGDRHVRVTGSLLFDVVPGKGAFTVDTARGRIEVLGTKFFVDAEADETIAAVLRGVVKLIGDGGDLMLHAGDRGVIAAGRAPVRGPAPRLSELVSWSREVRRETPSAAAHHGTLFARDPGIRSHPPWGNEYPLPIAKLGVDVVVEDQVARIALDQTFRNDADEQLEGIYRFAIPPDAALQRLAMYVDGKLTESAVIERMTGRRIYEDLVYRRVDPALLEWAGAGRLSLRVYPLPPHQDKRLALAYTQSLPKLYNDWTLTVPLPDVDRPVGELDIAMRVKGCASCELTSTSFAIAVTRDGDDAIVRYHGAAEKIGDALVVHVRDPRNAVTFTIADDGADRFALVRAPLDVGAARPAYRPHTWVILDDVSASRDKLELAAQTDLVDALVRELDEDDRVAVVAFDAGARVKLDLAKVRDVDRATLRRTLGAEGGIGATDVAAAFDRALPLLAGVAPEDATIVYLGDGVVTSGARQLDALRANIVGKAQFVGVGVGDGVDTQLLVGLAAATGGYSTAIDLADDLDWRALDLVAALHTSRVTGIAAKLVADDGSDVSAATFVRSPQLAEGEQLELVAKLAGKAPPTAVVVSGTRDGKPWSQRIALGATKPNAGYLPRLWAQRKIDALLATKYEPVAAGAVGTSAIPDPRDARDEDLRQQIVALGKRYFLLSRHTSLLVLENDAMYQQYGVTKGDGATWASYAMPSTIPVKPTSAVSSLLPPDRDDVEVVRRPFAGYATDEDVDRRGARWAERVPQNGMFELDGNVDPTLKLWSAPNETGIELPPIGAGELGDRTQLAQLLSDRNVDYFTRSTHRMPIIDHLGGDDLYVPRTITVEAPYTGAYDDLTAFVPGLVADATDDVRAELRANGSAPHAIDAAAIALLTRAHVALPAGVYQWGDREIAVDADHHFGWRATSPYLLGETAAFDGARFTRRFAELGLDVTRPIGDDDVALALGSFPIWIAEPAHWAEWFDVSARGAHELALSTTRGLAYVVRFDASDRLVSIVDGDAHSFITVSWDDRGPIAARVRGEAIAVSYAATPIANAVAWANPGPASEVAIELPEYAPAYWNARLAAQTAGSRAWRQLQRELIASLASTGDADATVEAFIQLARHGGIARGDVVLASRGIASSAHEAKRDRELAEILAPLANDPIEQYLWRYRRVPHATTPRPSTVARDTLIGTLWAVQSAVSADDDSWRRSAHTIDSLLEISERAPFARWSTVNAIAQRGWLSHDELARAWDTAASGRYRNIARGRAAQELQLAGHRDDASARIVELMTNPDLGAEPPELGQLAQTYLAATSNDIGWQLLWRRWSDRMIAGTSYDHVIALAPLAARDHGELFAVLDRARELAGDDLDRTLQAIAVARQYGMTAWADGVLDPLARRLGTRELHLLAGQVADSEQRYSDALDHFEAAFDAGGIAARSTVVAELRHIFADCTQLALQTRGAAHVEAVARAKRWVVRGHELELADPTIDRDYGELLLRDGDSAEAWRYLSSAIDRDPWSSAGYASVAAVYAKLGRFADAQPLVHQAVLVDQTNPDLRLEEAKQLLALGRPAEAKAELHDIVTRNWHSQFVGVVANAQALIETLH